MRLVSQSRSSVIAFAVGILLLAFSAQGMAGAADDLGPPIGSAAPDIGAPPDQTGKPRTLASAMGERGLVLVFFRSAAWCPYCQAQLIELNAGRGEIERRGYRLAGISYDSVSVLAAFAERREIGYTLLSDPQSEIIDRYGLRDGQYQPGSRAFGVPRPIILVLDRAGTIRAKLYEETYRTRPPVTQVLAALDKLAPGHGN